MEIVLIYPPQASLQYPYSSIPDLTSFVKEHSDVKIHVMDLNVEVNDHFLTPEFLKKACNIVLKKLRKIEHQNSINIDTAEEYHLMATISGLADNIIANINYAKEIMRSSDFYDINKININGVEI